MKCAVYHAYPHSPAAGLYFKYDDCVGGTEKKSPITKHKEVKYFDCGYKDAKLCVKGIYKTDDTLAVDIAAISGSNSNSAAEKVLTLGDTCRNMIIIGPKYKFGDTPTGDTEVRTYMLGTHDANTFANVTAAAPSGADNATVFFYNLVYPTNGARFQTQVGSSGPWTTVGTSNVYKDFSKEYDVSSASMRIRAESNEASPFELAGYDCDDVTIRCNGASLSLSSSDKQAYVLVALIEEATSSNSRWAHTIRACAAGGTTSAAISMNGPSTGTSFLLALAVMLKAVMSA